MHAGNDADRTDSTVLWLVLEHLGINWGMNAHFFFLNCSVPTRALLLKVWPLDKHQHHLGAC